MKKTVIITLFVLILSAVAFAATVTTHVGTYDNETKEAIINLKAGWNIIPFGSDLINPEDCQIKAVWYWIPTVKEYLGNSYPNKTMDSSMQYLLQQILDDKQGNYLYAQENGAFAGGHWLNVGNECSIKKNFAVTSNESIDGMKLAEGWNFIIVSPGMVGLSISE